MNNQDDPSRWAHEAFAVGQTVPRADDPVLARGVGRGTGDPSLHDHPAPATALPLGTTGCGAAGGAGAPVSSDLRITHIDMPVTPGAVWRAIDEASAEAAP